MKILVVEDHQDSAQALCRLLTSRLGGTVECKIVTTLKESLQVAIEYDADITILDLNLPGSTVIEVIESIPYYPPPVIVVTDLDDPDHNIEIACYENEAQNFFSKSVLRSTVVTKEGAELLSAITKAHWRRALPSEKARAIRAKMDSSRNGS
jgi:DNA-binding response OmpR family regulator